MEAFTFSYPTRIYFGAGGARRALEAELGGVGDTVLLAYGGGSIKRNGIYDGIMGLLTAAGKRAVEFSGIMPNPTYAKVQEGAALARREGVGLILAVGGGSVVDCCKVVAAQALLDEDIWELEYVKGRRPNRVLPMGAIVTASGTGAEMNGGGVITHEAKKWKGGIFASRPAFAVLDPAYTLSVPRAQVLSGAFDTLSHAMESFLGNSDADNASDDLALAVMKNTVTNIRRLLVNMDDLTARSNLMWDSAMAENGILKCGRQPDFQAHRMEHQLGAYTDCNHGMGLAVIQPVYYRHILQDAPEKFRRMARVVFDAPGAAAGLDALEALIRDCGLPTRLRELKSTVEITPALLRQVADTAEVIQTNPRPLGRDEIYDILMECL